MAILADTFSVCHDCFILEATGDATFLDHDYCEPEASQRLKEIVDGMTALTADGGHLSAGEQTDEFARTTCDCCGNRLAGARFSMYLLKPE